MTSPLSFAPYTPWPVCSPWLPEPAPEEVKNFTFELATSHPKWHAIASSVGRSVATITLKDGTHLGCAVLVGIDRLLIPYHIVLGYCLEDLTVGFVVEDQSTGITYSPQFSVRQRLYCDVEKDFCLMQLDPMSFDGRHAGHFVPPVAISTQRYQGEFMFVHHLSSKGHVATIGLPCEGPDGSGYFCSTSPTEAGSSGGIYFDIWGRVFAMHLARSTGLCTGFKERKAIYLSEIIRQVPSVMEIPRCTPICQTPKNPTCFTYLKATDQCYIDEAGRPVVHSTISEAGKDYAYWEMRDVGSRRGIRIVVKSFSIEKVKGKSQTKTSTELDAIFTIQPDPHTVAAYNKNQPTFYEAAAKAFIRLPIEGRSKWVFSCYKQIFEGVFVRGYLRSV